MLSRYLTVVVALVLMVEPVNTVEITPDISFIKVLPAGNPYQSLYDEMLAPTVRISSPSGIGSGVVINRRGAETAEEYSYILTANHVVGNQSVVTVTIYSYISNTQAILRELCASVVITDTNKDLALLKLNPSNPHNPRLYTAKLAPRDYRPLLFTPIYTIGCSLGLSPRPSEGIITVIDNDSWQVSSPILPGNSGGPVFDTKTHDLIGIAVWVKVYRGQLVTTMAGIVPISEIYKFLDGVSAEGGSASGGQESEGSSRVNEFNKGALKMFEWPADRFGSDAPTLCRSLRTSKSLRSNWFIRKGGEYNVSKSR